MAAVVESKNNKHFFVYLLRCSDNTLYCGWTIDLKRRLAAHNSGKRGAKYTRT
ncbi:MAG: GIY-YIG nuclease family protein, partial [Synergistaceae bacterium]|nr:GIY-YIG nuclease family protein [Synergistaceae bacterium]